MKRFITNPRTDTDALIGGFIISVAVATVIILIVCALT